MTRRPGAGFAVSGLVVLGLLGLFVGLRLPGRVTTEVTEFLGAEASGPGWRLSRLLREGELTRGLILTVGGPDPAAARAAAGEIAAVLSASPEVAWVRAGAPEGVNEAFQRLYWPRRLALLPCPPDELAAWCDDAGLTRAVADLRAGVAGPAGPLVKRLAPGDPLQLFLGHVRRIEAGQAGGLREVEGQLVAPDGWSVVFLAGRASAFDTRAQRALQETIARAFAQAAAARPGLRLRQSGVALVALASERSVKADTQRISLLSMGGIVLLFLLLFRSPRLIALGLLPLGAGFLLATSAGLLVFGRLHGLTLAFGSTLLGVCIDYPVHLFNHHALDGRAPDGALSRVWPGLLLGALTTVAGFSGLAWTSFPGVREIALFAAVGVLGALGATRWLVAPLLPPPAPVAARERLGAALARLLGALEARRALVALLLAAPLLLLALGLPRLRWDDQASALYRIDPALRAEQEEVWARVQRPDGARFVVVEAPDDEAALRLVERAARGLTRAVEAGALDSFRSLRDLAPSAAAQARAHEAWRAVPELSARLDRALAAAHFRPALFGEWRTALAAPPPPPLTLDELLASPLRDLVRPFVLRRDGEGVALLTYVRGVRDPAALEAALFEGRDALPRLGPADAGALYFDQDAFLAAGYARHRREILQLVGGGLLAVLALIALRYRSPRVTLAAFLPALLAGVGALALRGLLGIPAQLLDAVALLLVFSMGADYGIFLAEGRAAGPAGRAGLPATLLSLAVACSTTVLAFGLLALSQEPPLRAIGLTVGTGVLLSLLLAPLALLVSGRAPGENPAP